MNNRPVLLSVSLAFLTCGLFLVGTSKVSGTHESATPNSALKLTTSILNKKLCVGDGEVSTLQMRLQLHYSNTGQRPIILYKGSSVVASATVSKTAADALAGRNELTLSTTILTAGRQEMNETQRFDSSFAMLPKGSSFNTISEVSVPFAISDQSVPRGVIKSGWHVLQIQTITWPESAELAEKLGNRWKRRGYLWHDLAHSEPMPFKIQQEVRLENCR